ncbi:hypothetical protein GWI33_004066 [Rhynchophorus ferrugineus]|uniref:Uncharacterized protein n=1 Tax=Rhynchophorus ferrugineus TaxID=354439 RepID=A0A834IPY9_RHYFE|nr:hypothetical protein GWI33_004066 [Rhynchophorus ferrugineus]
MVLLRSSYAEDPRVFYVEKYANLYSHFAIRCRSTTPPPRAGKGRLTQFCRGSPERRGGTDGEGAKGSKSVKAVVNGRLHR